MQVLFTQVWRLSLCAIFPVAVVCLLRACLSRGRKKIRCLLWALVALCLVCPWRLPSLAMARVPAAGASIAGASMSGASMASAASALATVRAVLSGRALPDLVAVVWAVGVGLMLLYALLSRVRLSRQLSTAICATDNVWLCDDIDAPFVLGMWSPQIYIPSHIDPRVLPHVMAHEESHIERRDNLWKPLAFVLLCVYWFAPHVWLAYILFCRDMELACDELAVSDMALDERKSYSYALLSMSAPPAFLSTSLGFGAPAVAGRVAAVLRYRQPTRRGTVAWALLLPMLLLCFFSIGVVAVADGYTQSTADQQNISDIADIADTASPDTQLTDSGAWSGPEILSDASVETNSAPEPQDSMVVVIDLSRYA